MKKDLREVPVKNYIFLGIIILVTILLLFYFYLWYLTYEESKLNDIWLSCNPWCSITSLVPTFNKEITIPQFIWDKYEKVNERYYTNLTILVHHGFADGYHIGQFVNLLEENIK